MVPFTSTVVVVEVVAGTFSVLVTSEKSFGTTCGGGVTCDFVDARCDAAAAAAVAAVEFKFNGGGRNNAAAAAFNTCNCCGCNPPFNDTRLVLDGCGLGSADGESGARDANG